MTSGTTASAHTAAPWVKSDLRPQTVWKDGTTPERNIQIASCEGEKYLSPDEKEANAKLIAAAPDLLLAAKEAFVVLGEIMKASKGYLSDCPALMHLNDAIKKAESTSPLS